MGIFTMFLAAGAAAIVASAAEAQQDESVLRPVVRPATLVAAAALARAEAPAPEEHSQPVNAAFRRWIEGFRGRALAQGISPRTFDRAFQDVRYSTHAIQKDRNQGEFTKTIWQYLESAVSQSRIDNGRAALRDHAATFEAIEARYGVEKEIVAAVWGMESAYGEYRGSDPLISSLATLAHDGRRGAFFEEQLVAAMKILENGDITPERMTGSWAGAMGHTQFIPTSYLAYAEDFTGDGRRDIWSDDPADALASTAAYLKRHGWTKGMPWGVEVRLPTGFDYALAGKGVKKSAGEWAALGVRGTQGGALPDHGPASILLPAGAKGAAFLVFKNFRVISRYNNADAYVIGVGHLGDRLKGGAEIAADWPDDERGLLFAERKELQQRLTAAGFDTRGADGMIGPTTMKALRGYQRSIGMASDGYPSLTVLNSLRR